MFIKKNNIILLLLLLLSVIVSAQTFSPTVIAAAGGYYTAGGDSYSCTIGETNTLTLQNGASLEQGFQHGELDIRTGSVAGNFICGGKIAAVPFTATALFNSNNIFTAQLSNASGSFASPVSIGTLSSANSGTINVSIPSSVPFGSGYRIRVVSGFPGINGINNGTDLAINAANTWTGGSSNWNSSNNWSCGIVPNGSSVDAVVSSGSPYLDMDITIRNLSLTTNLLLNGKTFTLNGSITGNGTFAGSSASSLVLGNNGSNPTLNFNSTADTLYNLTLNNNATATLGSNLNLAARTYGAPAQLNIGSSAAFNTANGLTLVSDSFNTAMVDPVQGTITGTVTVQRYIRSNQNSPFNSPGNIITGSDKRAWRLLTAPVQGNSSPTIFSSWQNNAQYPPAGQGTFISGPGATGINGNGLDAGINGNSSMESFDTTLQKLNPIANTKVAISAGTNGSADNTGYFIFIRGDRNPQTIGNPNFGNVLLDSTTLSATGTLQTGNQLFSIDPSTLSKSRYTLVGNPYAAPVDLNTVTFTNALSTPTVYTWDPNLGDVGGYIILQNRHNAGFQHSPTPPSAQDNYIQSSQAFFVLGNTATGQSITVKETDKAASNNNEVFRPVNIAGADETFSANLYRMGTNNADTLEDGIQVYYNYGYCSCASILDGDAPKLPQISETFGLLRDGKEWGVEDRPIIVNYDTLFFNITNTTQRNYQFRFTDSLINPPGLTAFLKDRYTGDSAMVGLGDTTINFTINSDTASQSATRFMVVFEPLSATPVTYTNIKAWQESNNNNYIAVQWNLANQLSINSYVVEKSIDGINFTNAATVKATGNANSSIAYNWIDSNAINGENYYRIISIGSNGVLQYSSIVKVNIGYGEAAIAVYPNPIEGGLIGLQFANMPEGKYGVHLIDNIGQVLVARQIDHAERNSYEMIRVNKNMSKGIYHLEINGPYNYQNDIKVVY